MSELIRLDEEPQLPLPTGDRHPVLVYLAGLAPTGRRTMLGKLRRVACLLGHSDVPAVPWHRLRHQHLVAIRTRLQGLDLAPATVNSMLQAVKGVCRAAFNLELMTADDLQRVRDVKPLRGERLPAGRAVTAGELGALMDACAADPSAAGVRDAAIIALMYAGGLRRSEIASLDLDAHHPETDEIVVLGKGNKERSIFIDNGAKDAVDDWRLVRGEQPGPLFVGIRKDGSVLHEQGGMSGQAIYAMLKKRATQAGVRDVSCHDLRRSFVSDLLDTGQVDISTAARLCGHAQVQTTARYDRRGDEAKRKAVALLHVPYRRRGRLPQATGAESATADLTVTRETGDG